MKRSRLIEEHVIATLKYEEDGIATSEVRRTHGISTATFYIYGCLSRCKGSSVLT